MSETTIANETPVTPIVVETKQSKKKKKKKYTRGLQGLQELMVASNKGHAKIASAISTAVDDWVERCDKSREKRRDGILKDGPMNASRAFSKGFKEAAKAPDRFLDELENSKLYKKRFKPFKMV
jgi:hypothetical protein